MFFNSHPRRRTDRGFSLVEIMIGVVVGMLGIVVIMQVFLVSEGQKRTTTGGADAQENGLMALFTMEQDIRMAGLGLVGTGCPLVSTWDDLATPQLVSKPMWPVIITRPTSPDPGTDQVDILYSGSPFANIPTVLTTAMPPTSSIINLLNGSGFVDGDLFVVSEPPKECTRAEATQDGQPTGGLGNPSWNLNHNPASRYNPSGGWSRFPAGGYGTGARVTNMGRMVDRSYFVSGNELMMRDNVAGTTVALVNGIVAIRAQYGRDTDANGFVDSYNNIPASPSSATEVISVRLAVVARSGQEEKDDVSPSSIVLWNGGTVGNGGELALNRRFRYKVYQTIIPLRNIVWNTP